MLMTMKKLKPIVAIMIATALKILLLMNFDDLNEEDEEEKEEVEQQGYITLNMIF